MTTGFGEDKKVRISVSREEINKIIKKYKKAKKLMRTNVYRVQVMDGTETYISGLIKEAEADPPE
jgi:ribosome recycling factor